MSYTIDRVIGGEMFETVVERTKRALSLKGFGVRPQIDVKATMKAEINEDVADYLIVGACNPTLAFGAMKIEPKVGVMLPRNVVVRSIDGGDVMVSAIDPVGSMLAIENPKLKDTAGKVRSLLEDAVGTI